MLTSLAIAFIAANPVGLERALQHAALRADAAVQLIQWTPPPNACRGIFEPAPVEHSGKVAVRVRGTGCESWGWAQVQVRVPAAVLIKEVKRDDSLDGAWTIAMVESRGETLKSIPNEATAVRALNRGAAVEPNHIRVGPKLGASITVRVVTGALSLEQRGTISACAPPSVCATLPSGKKVSGVWTQGVLQVGEGT